MRITWGFCVPRLQMLRSHVLNSFLIGRTCRSRASGGTRCFQLFVARWGGKLNKQRIPTTTYENRRQKLPLALVLSSDLLTYRWT